MQAASFYTKLENNKVKCNLCPHLCIVPESESGICKVRSNYEGELYSDIYGRISGMAVDPIEKKPLYHFFPGSGVLSVGSIGCNMSCSFCQNAHISQTGMEDLNTLQEYTPKEIVDLAIERNHSIIAYTYNEPTVFFEFMLDTARIANSRGLKNVMVSNGFINEKPLNELFLYMDAFNIDLKAFDDNFYKLIVKARIEPVLRSIHQIAKSGKHMELTSLIIPGLNDNKEQFSEMIAWISNVCGSDQVFHLSRYFPNHKMQQSATPLISIEELMGIARLKLHYVYPGNTGLSFDSNTYCSNCQELLIERNLYSTSIKGLTEGYCINCHSDIPGIFN